MSNDFLAQASQDHLRQREIAGYRARAASGVRMHDSVVRAKRDPETLFTAEEIEALDAQAVEVQEKRAATIDKAHEAEELRQTTELILAKWDLDRRAEAEKEARRRLGLDGGEAA